MKKIENISKRSRFEGNNKITKMNHSKNKIVCAIACRLDSSRLFGKPLQLIDNRTILELQIIQIKKSKLIDEIVLAISKKKGNEVFIEFANKNNLKYVRGDEDNVSDRLRKAARHVNANIIFRTTSEDPFKLWQIFDSSIKSHIQNNADITYPKKLPEGTGFEIISLEALNEVIKKGNKKDLEHVTSYILKFPKKFKHNVIQIPKNLRRDEIRLTVDNPEDLILIREIMSKFRKSKTPPKLERIITIMDKNSELKKINKKFVNKDRKWV